MVKKDLQSRLRRLGVVKGARQLVVPPVSPREVEEERGEAVPMGQLLPDSRLVETAVGSFLLREKVYSLTYRHGGEQLGALLAYEPTAVAWLDFEEEGLSFTDFVFVDTETTGLAGAGTLAFMVGAGFFECNQHGEPTAFVVRQYFLRDHGDEAAMLAALGALMATKKGVVTFNGRTFDLPLLNSRHLMIGDDFDWLAYPHIDLLGAARRLWRLRWGSVALGALEGNVLGVKRTQADVPGALIPGFYQQFLRDGNGERLLGVFYHNLEDILSLVTLAKVVWRQCLAATERDAGEDLVSLARWQNQLGLVGEAEGTLHLALMGERPLAVQRLAWEELGYLLKRQERLDEALTCWQRLAVTSYEDVTAHVELAKYYEWQEKDLATAKKWTEQALGLCRWWSGGKGVTMRDELRYRLARLERKLEGGE
ncbi:MAG TPA: ribonuclease H-like domain-containing protein [Anaerolineae bacterium]|nr:ribonuclease H-like domain-containing protein [Anaerolineae bacterium]